MKSIAPDWPAPASIKAFTTIKDGWGSPTVSTKDQSERKRLSDLLELPSDPIWLDQTHTSLCIEAKPEHRNQNADASYTTESNVVCLVLTADCLPLLICNKSGTEVAAIHAGWRGLAGGIIENTINKMQSAANELIVWLGPAIGPNKFEVGPDVFTAFTQHDPSTETAFNPQPNNKWLANLYELARIRLNKLDIHAIYGGSYCTHSQADLFYSYRRDQGKTGRMASLIWINR